jgi:type I restriction enzyme S subunit
MEKYEIKTIKQIANTQSGGTPSRKVKDYYNGDIPWVKSGELRENIITETEEKITQTAIDKSSAKLLPINTLLVAMYGANVGRVAILGIEAATNQAICAIQPKDDLLSTEYLYYYFIYYKNQLLDKAFGGAQKNISQQVIKNLEIPFPTIQQQKQIVSKIKECFILLDKSEEKLRQAEEKLDKVMDSAIVKYIEVEGINKKWDLKYIKDICEINPSKTEIKELPLDTKVAFVQMSSVSDKTGTIETQEIRTLEEVKKGYTYFKKGDIIFAKITPCMENGKTSLTDNLKTAYGFGSTEFHVLRVDENKVIPEYLYIILRSQRFRKLAMTNMTGTAGQKRLPKDYLAEYKIYVPSIEEQQHIVTRLHKIEAERTKYNFIYGKSLNRLSYLRQSILKKAFEGKLI